MPVYEYQCAKCGERFEQLVRSFSRQATPACPKCGATDVCKAVSLFGISRKGGQASAASCAPTGT